MKRSSLVKSAILFAFAVMSATLLFSRSAHDPYTLVLQIKSLETGVRRIVAVEQDGGERHIPFEIVGEIGRSAVHAVELPRRQLKKIIIPPLATAGNFEIERITLMNSSISFRWDGSDECRSHFQAQPVGSYSPCDKGAPVIESLNDAIIIKELPSTGVAKILSQRVIESLLFAVLTFLAGAFLLRPVEADEAKIGVYAERGGWLLVTVLYLWQFIMLWRYSVDIPFWEEWEFFEPTALQRGLTLEWLFAHFGTNQQVVVFTKLMAWLDLKLFDLDFTRLKLMNYLVFGLYLVTVKKFVCCVTGGRFKLLPFFMLFLVSPLAYEVHSASFQSGEVFVMLFSTLMLCYAAPEKPSLSETVVFSAAAIGAIYSMHTGVVVAGLLLIGRSLFILLMVSTKKYENRDWVVDLSLTWLITTAGIGYWLAGFSDPSAASVRLMPTAVRFWEQFLDLLSFGFGFGISTPVPGMFILLFLMVPLVLLFSNKKTGLQRSSWQIMLSVVILLTIAAMITFGRGAAFTTLKLSRYTVYISPLIIFGAVAWWLALKERLILPWMLAAFWVFCSGAFSNNWSYGIYRDLRQIDLAVLECVGAYNDGRGDGNCPDTHGVPVGGFFDNARKLGISFTRQFAGAAQPK